MDLAKQIEIDKMKQEASVHGFTIVEENLTKPWGAYLRFANKDVPQFVQTYFPEKSQLLTDQANLEMSPKYLLIAPQARLSWQYHHRRSEIWRVVSGPVGAITSNSDEQSEAKYFSPGTLIEVAQGQRHRLVCGEGWGLVAEIWQHLDPAHPSDEEDNVRLADDYNRQGSSDRGEAVFFDNSHK